MNRDRGAQVGNDDFWNFQEKPLDSNKACASGPGLKRKGIPKVRSESSVMGFTCKVFGEGRELNTRE